MLFINGKGNVFDNYSGLILVQGRQNLFLFRPVDPAVRFSLNVASTNENKMLLLTEKLPEGDVLFYNNVSEKHLNFSILFTDIHSMDFNFFNFLSGMKREIC
jgi:hypothetical protein